MRSVRVNPSCAFLTAHSNAYPRHRGDLYERVPVSPETLSMGLVDRAEKCARFFTGACLYGDHA